MYKPIKNQTGFTVLELIVFIVVGVIFVSLIIFFNYG